MHKKRHEVYTKHKAIGVKQAWNIKNYRYICNVSRTKEVEVVAREERHVAIGVYSPPKGPSLYRGRGAPYPLPKAALGQHPGEERAARAGGAQPPPPKTLTLAILGQGSRAPPFFSLMGLFSEIGPLGDFNIY
jgi:hypothetical protein